MVFLQRAFDCVGGYDFAQSFLKIWQVLAVKKRRIYLNIYLMCDSISVI